MTHYILTEPSLSPHPRKGREGKGRENYLGHPSIHLSVVGPAVEWMHR